jgi:hypothetical protein
MTADKVGDDEYDENGFNENYGFGRINACKAVIKAFEMAGNDVSELVCDPEPTDFEYPDVDYELEDDAQIPDLEQDEEMDEAEDESLQDDSVDNTVADEDALTSDTVVSDEENDKFSDEDSEMLDDDISKKDNGCSCSFIKM